MLESSVMSQFMIFMFCFKNEDSTIGSALLCSRVNFVLLQVERYYREISTNKRVNDKSFIAKMYNSRHSITGLQGGHGAWYELSSLPVLDDPVVVAVLHILQGEQW